MYKELEKEFALFSQRKYAVSVNSGTSALHLALLAMGVRAGDEVIVPDLTFVACAFAVSYIGATPVFVDCNADYNMDVTQIEDKITSKTKVIMAVHLLGRKCDIDDIVDIAQKYKLKVLEDMSQAHGINPTVETAVYSLQATKIISAEEGGVIVTNSEEVRDYANFSKSLANNGDYFHPRIGFNYRMPSSQAKIALESLRNVENELSRRRELEAHYGSILGFGRQRDVVWAFDYVGDRSEELRKIQGVRAFFKPLSSLPMYKQTIGKNAQRYSENGVIIPLWGEKIHIE